MTNNQFFSENGEFTGSAADFDAWKCKTCGELFNGLDADDAAEDHSTQDEGFFDDLGGVHEFELDENDPHGANG